MARADIDGSFKSSVRTRFLVSILPASLSCPGDELVSSLFSSPVSTLLFAECPFVGNGMGVVSSFECPVLMVDSMVSRLIAFCCPVSTLLACCPVTLFICPVSTLLACCPVTLFICPVSTLLACCPVTLFICPVSTLLACCPVTLFICPVSTLLAC